MKITNPTNKGNNWFRGDATIWTILLVLCAISIVEVYSASSNISYKTGAYWEPVMEHSLYVVGGIFTAWLLHLIPCKLYKLLNTFTLHVVAYPLLVIAMFAAKTNGAGRWIHIFGRTIQPSEIAKIALVGFVAFVFAALRDEKGHPNSTALKIVGIETLITAGIICTENFSTALMVCMVIFLMAIVAEVKKKYLVGLFATVAIAGSIAVLTMKTMSMSTAVSISETIKPMHRLPTWVSRLQKGSSKPENPKEYDVVANQQVAHATIAVATCNVVGHGPGQSVERDYLPMAFSDYIYAIIIEEGGIESAAIVMALYLLLLYRVWRISRECVSPFPIYLATGLALMLVVQAMINMSVAVGLFPVTGQPLPLISKGGTSTFITCAYIGMILSVSYTAKRIEPATASQAVANANGSETPES